MKKQKEPIAKIQPNEFGSMLPYPYFVYEDGLIGKQDVWNGKPFKLLGFNKEPVSGDISLPFSEFKKHKIKAIGMYPVFEYKDGNWVTSKMSVESI